MHHGSWPGAGVSISSRVKRMPHSGQCFHILVGGGYRTMPNQLDPQWQDSLIVSTLVLVQVLVLGMAMVMVGGESQSSGTE